jgi:hypothetical protein
VLNLGDLTFGITANTAGLQAAQQQLQSFGRALQGTVTKAKGDIDATTSALIRQEGAALRALQQVQSMQNKIASGGLSPAAAQRLTSQLEAAFTKFSGAQAQRSPLNQLQQSRQAIAFSEQLQDVARSFGAESAAAKEAASASNAVQAAFEKQSLAAIRAEESVRVLQERLEQLQKAGTISPARAGALGGQLTGALGSLKTETLGAGADPLNSEAMLRSSLKFSSAVNAVKGEMSTAQRAAAPLNAAFRGISDALILSTGPFGMFAFRLRAATDLMKEFGPLVGGSVAAIVGMGVAVFALGDAMLHADIALQQVDVTLKAVTGSAIVAKGEIAYLRDTANQAGLQFQEIAPYFARFEASANATGQTINVTHQEFSKLAMIMGTLHLGVQQTSNVIRTFDEIMSQGYVQTRNVVRQLATELPGAMDIAKKAAEEMTGKVKITGAELEKMMSGKMLPGPQFAKAFIDVATKVFGVDMTKQIDTLQASIGRLNNAWNYFLTTLSDTVGASQLFSDVIKGMTDIINEARTHIAQIVGVLAGMAGAMAGIAASLFVWSAVGAAITFVTAALRSSGIAAYFAAGAMDVLKIAMSPGFFIALAQAALAVVSALAGFKLASDAATQAMDTLNLSMYKGSTGQIQDYINAQKNLKDQVDATTRSYLYEAQALSITLVGAQKRAQAEFDKAQGPFQRIQRAAAAGIKPGSLSDLFDSPENWGKVNNAMADASNTLRTVNNELTVTNTQVAQLFDILKKPNKAETGLGDAAGGGKKGPSPFAGTSEIAKVIEEAQTAKQRIDDLLANPTANTKTLEDLAKAKDLLYDISHSKDMQAQLNVVVGLMNQAGDKSIGMGAGLAEVTKHLQTFITAARTGDETLKDWADTQTRIKKGAIDLVSEQQRIDALVNGLNPDAMDLFKKPLDEAQKLINELQQFPALLAALEAQTKGAPGEDFAHRLASLLGGGTDIKEAEKPLQMINEDVLTMSANLASLKAGSVGTILDQGYLQQATKALEGLDSQGLAKIEASLSRFETVTGSATADLATFLKTQALVQQATDAHKQALENNIKAWQTWADGVVDSVGKVLNGTESLGTGIKDIFHSLATTIVQSALIDPMKLAINQGISNMMTGITSGFGATSAGGIFGAIGNVIKAAFGGGAQGFSGAAGTSAALAATTSLTAATTATAASTTAQGIATATATASLVAFTGALDLASVAAMGSATSGITSFLSPLIGVGTLMSVATGTQGPISGPGTTTSDSILARVSKGEWIINAAVGQRYGSLLRAITTGKALPGFAYGGVAGNAAGDLFVPGVGSQAMSAAITNANSTGIDARAYIDARGATPDAVEALRDEMRIREAKLKSQLPQIIDARTVDNRVRNRWGMAY